MDTELLALAVRKAGEFSPPEARHLQRVMYGSPEAGCPGHSAAESRTNTFVPGHKPAFLFPPALQCPRSPLFSSQLGDAGMMEPFGDASHPRLGVEIPSARLSP